MDSSTSTPPHMPQVPAQPPLTWRRAAATMILLSLLVGSLAGGIFGYIGATLATKGRLPNFTDIKTTATTSTTGTTTAGTSTTVEENSATIDAVTKVAPSVVSVITKQDLSKIKQQNTFDPFNGFFFSFPGLSQPTQPQTGTKQISAGSGFIVSADGMILTNKHVVADVVANPDLELTVVFNDGSEHTAKVLGTDPLNDLAVIKIDGKDLPVAQFGDSSSLKLGETVIAIGNALGQFSNTVTRGVISGMDRTIQAGDQSTGASETIDEAIQTDAAINHGNSGGPLINLSGQVIGVNTAIDESGNSLGFSIPINTAKQVVDSIKQNGKIVRPYLGVRYIPINDAVKTANKLSVNYGALVAAGNSATEVAVLPGSPADKAGIVENDIILELNGKKITETDTLASYMRKQNVGDTIKLKILHKGEEKTIDVKLEALDTSTAS